MTDKNASRLMFEYNEKGKPIKINLNTEDGDTSSINVKYDENGKAEKIESEEGYFTGLKVTQVFQTLLSLVKPAGVDFSF